AEGHDRVADGDLAGVAERDGGQARGVLQLEDGDVLGGVRADDRRLVAAPVVDRGDGDLGGAVHDVVVGQDQPVRGEDHARPGAGGRPVVDPGVDVDDAGIDGGGDLGRRLVGGRLCGAGRGAAAERAAAERAAAERAAAERVEAAARDAEVRP